jgi:hypothetical protein
VGIVAADSAMRGNVLNVDITVPPKIVQTGFDSDTVERIFIAEAERFTEIQSIIPAPALRISSKPDLLTAMATPIRLDNAVGALQDQFGYNRMEVHASIIADGTNPLRILMVIEQPYRPAERILLTQADGDADALVRRAAGATMIQISPYRSALSEYSRGIHGDPAQLAVVKEIATRDLMRSWDPNRASQRAMLRNLLALLALIEGDMARAKHLLEQVDSMPDVLPEARGIVMLNRTFLAVAEKRSEDARSLLAIGTQLAGGIQLNNTPARIETLRGLVAWSGGDMVQAEQSFRHAIMMLPVDEGPHRYLANILTLQGDEAGAAKERAASAMASPYEVEIPGLAQSVFWVDPINGGITRR